MKHNDFEYKIELLQWHILLMLALLEIDSYPFENIKAHISLKIRAYVNTM